jgi:hypothetical protein
MLKLRAPKPSVSATGPAPSRPAGLSVAENARAQRKALTARQEAAAAAKEARPNLRYLPVDQRAAYLAQQKVAAPAPAVAPAAKVEVAAVREAPAPAKAPAASMTVAARLRVAAPSSPLAASKVAAAKAHSAFAVDGVRRKAAADMIREAARRPGGKVQLAASQVVPLARLLSDKLACNDQAARLELMRAMAHVRLPAMASARDKAALDFLREAQRRAEGEARAVPTSRPTLRDRLNAKLAAMGAVFAKPKAAAKEGAAPALPKPPITVSTPNTEAANTEAANRMVGDLNAFGAAVLAACSRDLAALPGLSKSQRKLAKMVGAGEWEKFERAYEDASFEDQKTLDALVRLTRSDSMVRRALGTINGYAEKANSRHGRVIVDSMVEPTKPFGEQVAGYRRGRTQEGRRRTGEGNRLSPRCPVRPSGCP